AGAGTRPPRSRGPRGKTRPAGPGPPPGGGRGTPPRAPAPAANTVAATAGVVERTFTVTASPSPAAGAAPSQFTSRRLIAAVASAGFGPTTTPWRAASRRTT